MVYLTVLTASMIVMVVGVSALLAVRLQHRVGEGTNQAARARVHARSAVELALQRISDDPGWRTTFTHDQWSDGLALGGAELRFKLMDADDVDLADDSTDRVWLYGWAVIGQTERLTRVMLQPKSQLPGANRLKNPDMEWGTRHWWTDGNAAELTYTDQSPHGGVGSLYLEQRQLPADSVNQTVTGRIRSGETYYLEAWVRLADHDDQVFLQLRTQDAVNGEQWFGTTTTDRIAQAWTRISATVTPQWSGTLQAAVWEVGSHERLDAFYLDDALLIPARERHEMVPVPGTWEQVVH